MSADEILAVVQAYRDGKALQYRHRSNEGAEQAWQDDIRQYRPADFNFYSYDYRVKPEPKKPREFWLVLLIGNCVHQFHTKGDALNFLACFSFGKHEVIHVREVLDETEGS